MARLYTIFKIHRNIVRHVRLFILISLLVAICAGCKKKPEPIVITPDVKKNHLQRNHIYGEVKYLYTTTFYLAGDSVMVSDTANFDKILDGRQPEITAIQQYTSDGFLLKFLKLNQQKDTILRREYHYNDLALPTRWEEYDSTRQMVTHGKYLYDRNNFLCGEQVFRGDSIAIAFAYKTDGIGNITGSTQSIGDYTQHTENKYNENGQVCKIVEYEPNGRVFKTVKIEYDNYGDEVNRCVYKSGNQLIEYTYNQYSQEGKQVKTIYQDKMHNLRETHYYFGHDRYNNWQTEALVRDNKILSIRKRQIIYYQN